MILRTIPVDSCHIPMDSVSQSLSFKLLIDYLEDTTQNLSPPMEWVFPKFIVERIHAIEQKEGPLSETNIFAYEEILNHLYYLTDNVLQRFARAWALGSPIGDKIYYGQEDFYALMAKNKHLMEDNKFAPWSYAMQLENKIQYLLILERCYHLPPRIYTQLFRILEQEVARYYQLTIDFSFVEVRCLLDQLPELDFSCIHDRQLNSLDDLESIIGAIDLRDFYFEGFTIMKFFDKTQDYAGVLIQDIISTLPDVDVLADKSSFNRDMIWGKLKDIIKSLTNTSHVQCSFFPLLELNGIPILTDLLAKESIFFGDLFQRNTDLCSNNELYDYLAAPYNISYGIDPRYDTQDQLFIHRLKGLGLTAYVCLPLKNKGKLVGCLELFTASPEGLEKQNLLKVVSYLPLITNLSIDLISTFKSSVNKVILNKYTSLQESVQWKFNQEAALYLTSISKGESTKLSLNPIRFDKVFPIYGAVDIRNSTKMRTIAFRKDSYQRMGILQLIVDQLESIGPSAEEQRFITRFSMVKRWLDDGMLDHFILDIISFFQDDVFQFLNILDPNDPLLRKFKQDYLKDNAGKYGVVNGASEEFEQTLHMLNSIIGQELDNFNAVVQSYFPSYFEKFRTDGIEYDMYIGQSITPSKVFDLSIINTIRKAQISSMITIANKTFKALDELPISLVTTQLIFIHPNPLDIIFRQDERRFDVDGGYNIRYEVIKKRIDKARILGTNERLVQPNKIAIVYSSPRVEEDLREILDSLAAQGRISPEIEQVALEELQGIEQLKAFRVSVLVG